VKLDEFNKYVEEINAMEISRVMEGDSGDEISKISSRLSVICARLGQEFAAIKNEYHQRFHDMTSGESPMSAAKAEKEAEYIMNTIAKEKLEPTRREIEYLREDLKGISMSGQSRVKSLSGERTA
jgi:hypothetical protein